MHKVPGLAISEAVFSLLDTYTKGHCNGYLDTFKQDYGSGLIYHSMQRQYVWVCEDAKTGSSAPEYFSYIADAVEYIQRYLEDAL